ncbi:MAG TPA: Flp pilus assembly protein CpaB, partial [Syntrophomonas sp.]|nr:Flp pilus assembly protein CpaB [Syntrophomonas sp.]
KTLTLAVSPDQARPLVLATERGEIRLLLRSPVDDSQYVLPPFRMNNFIQP